MVKMTRRITDVLAADHARLHALLEASRTGAEVDRAAFAAFREGLLRHIAIEEKLLLPAVRQVRGGQPLEEAFDLRIDHAALTSLLVPTPDHPLCAEIHSLLAGHDAKEEGAAGVYAACEVALGAAASARLAAEAEAYPEVRVMPHNDGPAAHRTAASALAAARRMRRPG